MPRFARCRKLVAVNLSDVRYVPMSPLKEHPLTLVRRNFSEFPRLRAVDRDFPSKTTARHTEKSQSPGIISSGKGLCFSSYSWPTLFGSFVLSLFWPCDRIQLPLI